MRFFFDAKEYLSLISQTPRKKKEENLEYIAKQGRADIHNGPFRQVMDIIKPDSAGRTS